MADRVGARIGEAEFQDLIGAIHEARRRGRRLDPTTIEHEPHGAVNGCTCRACGTSCCGRSAFHRREFYRRDEPLPGGYVVDAGEGYPASRQLRARR